MNNVDKVLQVTFSILRKPPSKISTILKKGPIQETCKYFRQRVAVNVVKTRQSSVISKNRRWQVSDGAANADPVPPGAVW